MSRNYELFSYNLYQRTIYLYKRVFWNASFKPRDVYAWLIPFLSLATPRYWIILPWRRMKYEIYYNVRLHRLCVVAPLISGCTAYAWLHHLYVVAPLMCGCTEYVWQHHLKKENCVVVGLNQADVWLSKIHFLRLYGEDLNELSTFWYFSQPFQNALHKYCLIILFP